MSLQHLAAAAATVAALAAPVTDPPAPVPPPATTTTAAPAPEPDVLVQLCIAVTLPQVDEILAQLADGDLVNELAALAPITAPDGGDPVGLDLVPPVGLVEVKVVLDCDEVTTPPPATTTTTTTAPPVATTMAPPTSTSAAPTTTGTTTPTATVDGQPDDEDGDGITQVRVTPQGGVATGDGSLAP